jgi:uncharacterized RDD family membrane protein YckC
MTVSPDGPIEAREGSAQLSDRARAPVAYAGFWVRVVAFLIDGIALSIITSVLGPTVGAGPAMEFESSQVQVNYGTNALSSLFGLIYFVGFWTWRSQTPGMMAFNMRVIRADDGGDVDIVRGILRYVGLIISFAVLLIGVIWAAFDGRKQGWHDKIASTVVVRPA